MCDDLGMSRSTLTELRKGRAKTINLEKASMIADYFGVSMDYLMGKEEPPIRRYPRSAKKLGKLWFFLFWCPSGRDLEVQPLKLMGMISRPFRRA